ncbi:MAG: inner membrane protein YpjD [Methylophilaceae bacterium]
MHHFILYLVIAFIYAAVAADFWRDSKTESTTRQLHSMMIALGLLLHGWVLYQDVFSQGFNFGLLNALSVIFWLTVLIYWLANLKNQLHSLQAFVLPPAALFALLPAFSAQSHAFPDANAKLFIAHITIALLAYSLFTFAALHALLMTIAERTLHNKPTIIKLPSFPPLLVMETLLFRVIKVGFVLLTLTLASGMLFSEEIFGKPLQFNHKVVFSISSWFIYGWLLFGRWQYGWRGKKAIRWTLAGFGLLLLAYVGSKFVLEVILRR